MTKQEISHDVPYLMHRDGVFRDGLRNIPEEVPIAMSYNGSTHAVMMATPGDFEDFALGFSLAENIISDPDEIESMHVEMFEQGIDIQIRLAHQPEQKLAARRRFMAGPVGCGLCGLDSIEQAIRPVTHLATDDTRLTAGTITGAMEALTLMQPLNSQTRALHGAGFFRPHKGMFAVREDVGRHNALDKLVGSVVRAGVQPQQGMVVITSRVSVEMVQKTVTLGAPVLAAISAPTALAIKTAQEANLTLVAMVRGTNFDVYTHPERIEF